MKALALLALLTIGFYWKLTLTRQFTFLAWPDLANQVLPWYEFQARAWHAGTLPLWDPYQWCGQSLAGQWQPGALFPLNWPLFLAPLRNGRLNVDLWHWHFVLLHLLAAALMYAYCRDLERSRGAAVLAGAGFSFGGYVGTTLWPQMMNGAVLTPLVFLFQGRPGLPNAALSGAALGFALLAGHHQPVLFVALAVAGVCLFERAWKRLAVTAGFAALLGAPAWLPAVEYGARAYRWVNLPEALRGNQTVPYLAHAPYGVTPLSLLGLVTPLDRGTTNPLAGLVVVSLALAAAGTRFGERPVRVHAALAVGGLAYALGAYSVFQGALYGAVPLLDKARSPGHAIHVTHFALAVLAAYGLDGLAETSPWTRRVATGLAAAGGLAWFGALAVPPSDRSNAVLTSAAVALLLAPALLRKSVAAVVALLLMELHLATNYLWTPRPELNRPADHAAVADFLRRQAGPFRIHADDRYVPYNFGDREGFEDTGGYLASVSADLFDLVALDWNRSALWLNQVYVISKEPTRPAQEEVFAASGGLRVYRNPDAFPRAWLAGRVRSVRDRAEAAAILQSGSLDPRREAFVYGRTPLPGACEPQGGVEWLARDIHRVAARVRTSCPSLAVFGDPAYAGWRARVDGRAAPVFAAYGALRAVVLEPGAHTVEFVFRPVSVYAGAGLAALGLIAAAVWSQWQPRQRKSTP